MLHDLQSLFAVTGGRRRFAVLLALRCPFDALRTVQQALFLEFAFEAVEGGDPFRLALSCAVFGLTSLFLFAYNGTVWSLYAAFVCRLTTRLRLRLFGHVSGLSLREMEAKASGEWFTRLNADVQSATAIIDGPLQLPHAVVAAASILISAGILVYRSPVIFALVMAFVIPHIWISQRFIAAPMTALKTRSQQVAARNADDMSALIGCADTAILYDAQGFLLSRFTQSSRELRRANMAMRRRTAAGSALLPLMGMAGYLALLMVGGGWIASGQMTFGELTAAFQYRGGVLVGLMMLVTSLVNIRASRAGMARVNEILKIPSEESLWTNPS